MDIEQLNKELKVLANKKKNLKVECLQLLFSKAWLLSSVIIVPTCIEKVFVDEQIFYSLLGSVTLLGTSMSLMKINNSKHLRYYFNEIIYNNDLISKKISKLDIKDSFILDGLDERKVNKELKRISNTFSGL